MRILMLGQNYPPVVGGEEQHIRKLSIELSKRGHDVAVACLRDGQSPDVMMDEGVRVYRVGGTTQRFPQVFSSQRRFAPPFPDPGTQRALWKIVKSERPEIVHAHNWLIHSFLPLKVRSGASLVLSLHDYSLRCPQKRLRYNDTNCDGPQVFKCLRCASTYYGPLKGIVTVTAHQATRPAELRAVDMFLPVSPAVALGNGLVGTSLPYRITPNFVSDDLDTPSNDTRALLQSLPQGDFLLFVGDLKRDKGIDVLLEAVTGITNFPPLVLIGRIYPETPTALPPNVQLIPGWPHEAVLQAWPASTLALVPSIVADSSPTVAIEAMAAGIPVIGTRVGGLPEIIADGVTGLLISPNNVSALREGIRRLLADPQLRQSMSQAARERAQMFKASTVIPKIEQVYHELRDHAGSHDKQASGRVWYSLRSSKGV